MADLDRVIREQRNALEALVQHVPGFRGYFDRENRREAAVYCLDLELVLDIEALVSDFDPEAPAPERLRGELVGLQRRLEDRRAAILGLVGE